MPDSTVALTNRTTAIGAYNVQHNARKKGGALRARAEAYGGTGTTDLLPVAEANSYRL
jgi:hypothetical protein